MNRSTPISDEQSLEYGDGGKTNDLDYKTNDLDYKKTRRIRIFVSSTFADMKEEREALARFVFPEVRRYADRFGIDFDFVDLRWGITEEEVRKGKVIELCLRNIDNCRPLFLGILGEYSGWIPDKSELEKNPNLQHFFPWISGMLGSTSMTELEIYYGSLLRHSHSIFLLRENIGEASESQLKLFSEIRQSYPDSSYSYADIEDFCRRIKDFIINFIDSEFPHKDWSPKDQYIMENTLMLSRLLSKYVARERFEKPINDFLENKDSQLLILRGEKGAGKKSMCAFIVRECVSKGVKCLYDFVGDYAKINQWQREAYEEMVESGERCVIVLANADFVGGGDNESIVIDWLKNPQKNIKIVLSTYNPDYILARMGSKVSMYPSIVKRPTFGINNSEQPSNYQVQASDKSFYNERVMHIDRFEREEASTFIVNKLAGSRKSLPIRLIEKILDNKIYRLPQYLDYLVDELIMYGSHDTLEDFLDYFLKNVEFDTRDTLNFIANKVFDGGEGHNNSHLELTIAFHDKVLGDRLCSRICEFLSEIGGYVEENAVKYCLGLSHYDWARFVNAFSRYLDFNNMGVRLEEYYYSLASSQSKQDFNDKLLEYYETMPSKYRKCLIGVCFKSSDKHAKLKKYISDPENYMSWQNMEYLRMGWTFLLEHEKDSDVFKALGFARELSDYGKNGYMSPAYSMLCDYFPLQLGLIMSAGLDLSVSVTPKESVHLFYNIKKVADSDFCKDLLEIFRLRFDGDDVNNYINVYLQFNELLFELFEKDDQESCEAFIEKTNGLLRNLQIDGEVPPLVPIDILTTRSYILSSLERYEEAIKELEDALFFAIDGIDIINFYLSIAEAKRRSGDIQGGINEIDIAVEIMSDLKLRHSPKGYQWNSKIAQFYEKIDELSAARYYLQEACRIASIFYGDESVEAGEMCKKLGEVNQALEDYHAAAAFYMRYIRSESNDATKSDINDVRMYLAACLKNIDRFSDMLTVYSDMPSDYRIDEISTSTEVFNFYIQLAFAAHAIHDYDTAITVLSRMLSALDGDYGKLDSVWFLLMSCHLRTGNLEAAKIFALKLSDLLEERKQDDCSDDCEDTETYIHLVLDTIEKCESGVVKWEDTSFATRKVCKEWIEELDYTPVQYSYFRLKNYRSKKDSANSYHCPISAFTGAEVIARQNEIIDGWQVLY